MTIGAIPGNSGVLSPLQNSQPAEETPPAEEAEQSGDTSDTTADPEAGTSAQGKTDSAQTPARSDRTESADAESLVLAISAEVDENSALELPAVIEPKTDPAFLTEDVAREMALKLQKSIEESMILTKIISASAAEVAAETASAGSNTADASGNAYDVIRGDAAAPER